MKHRTPDGDAFTSIVIKGMQLSGLLELAGDSLAKPAGQSAARWKVLGGVNEGLKTVAEIARFLNLSRQGVQRIADTLVDDGLAQFMPNPQDRRADLLALTVKGKEALSEIQARQRQWANQLGQILGKKTMLNIAGALEQLITVLKDSGR